MISLLGMFDFDLGKAIYLINLLAWEKKIFMACYAIVVNFSFDRNKQTIKKDYGFILHMLFQLCWPLLLQSETPCTIPGSI